MLWDNLTGAEVAFTQHVLNTLKSQPWAATLIRAINDSGGIVWANMPFLFEARIAYALHGRGCMPDCEYQTGVGGSSVDFRIVANSTTWLIEVVKIGESAAAKAATRQDGTYVSRVLRTPLPNASAAEAKQSPEGELLLVEQKIAEKVVRGRSPIKFPKPTLGSFHMIIIDTRAFGNGGDEDDYAQIAYGPAGVADARYVHHWRNPKTNKMEPIKGLFDTGNPLRGASLVQERVHFLGFVAERTYKDEEIQGVMRPFANPHLLGNEQEAAAAWKKSPFSSGFRNA
jgi:hypothetical protein